MNEKELLTRDLCGRLTHGIFVETQESISNDYGEIEETYDITDIMCIFHLDNFMNHGVKLKPIYRPMSDLTKLITQANYNDGKQFVPIVELAKLSGHTPRNDYRISEKSELIWEGIGTHFFCFDTEKQSFKHGIDAGKYFLVTVAHQSQLFDFLDMCHFNRRNLPSHLWVDVNSLENDCYA